MAIVYQATCVVNGKRYIGFTSIRLAIRRGRHINKAKGGSPTKFHRALIKYGIDNFEWSILSEHQAAQEAMAAEIRWIAELSPEYNLTTGGEGTPGKRLTPAQREIALANLRQPRSAEFCSAISARLKGHVVSIEQRAKQSKTRMERPPKTARKVQCLEDGIIYISAAAAARAYGAKPQSISDLCSGRNPNRLTCAGRRFAYVQQTLEDMIRLADRANARRRSPNHGISP